MASPRAVGNPDPDSDPNSYPDPDPNPNFYPDPNPKSMYYSIQSKIMPTLRRPSREVK